MRVARPQVTLLDHMGSDLDVANAARVSFHKESRWDLVPHPFCKCSPETCEGWCRNEVLSKSDADLIRYLATGLRTAEREALIDRIVECRDRDEARALIVEIRRIATHWSPFTHAIAKFRVKAPMFVARQLWKHHIGLASQDETLGWNEVSRRYVDEEPEFYVADRWRKRAPNVKQGSSDETVEDPNGAIPYWVKRSCEAALNLYNALLDMEVAPEQARMVLPQNMMTEWIWTGSVAAFARICVQRLDGHAQTETREIARLIANHMADLFPVSWKALIHGE